MKLHEAIGAKVGKLKVLARAPYDRGKNPAYFCVCDCGNFTCVRSANLGRATNSCGCLRALGYNIKHHRTLTTEYIIWKEMKARCSNKNHKSYKNYGGRGIKVCDRWLESFENFLWNMGMRPSSEYSLDRIKNDEGYSRENCKWSTRIEQANNRRPISRWKLAFEELSQSNFASNSMLSFGM